MSVRAFRHDVVIQAWAVPPGLNKESARTALPYQGQVSLMHSAISRARIAPLVRFRFKAARYAPVPDALHLHTSRWLPGGVGDLEVAVAVLDELRRRRREDLVLPRFMATPG